jgi:phosphate transport system substrate-binding protein
MKNLFRCIAICILAAPWLLRAADDDLAVIVNKTNSVDNLTKAQLRKFLLGEQDSWSSGKKVSVILRSPGQPERDGVLRSVCGLTEETFTHHLMQANFAGDTGAPPKSLGSAVAVRQLVMTLPGGIGFVRVSELNDSVKVVTVDGIAAGQPGYKIKAGK